MVINATFISILNTIVKKPHNPNRNIAVKEENKVQATSLFPKNALSGTKE